MGNANGIATNAELEEFVTTGVMPESLKYTIKMEGFPNGADDAIDKAVKAKLKSGDAATKALLKRLNLTKYKGEKQGVSISEIIDKHLASAKISANDTHKLKTIQYVIRHIGWDALTPPQKETILKIGGTESAQADKVLGALDEKKRRTEKQAADRKAAEEKQAKLEEFNTEVDLGIPNLDVPNININDVPEIDLQFNPNI